jgi:hypothetical protein
MHADGNAALSNSSWVRLGKLYLYTSFSYYELRDFFQEFTARLWLRWCSKVRRCLLEYTSVSF